jgi:hypothetical protein
MSKRPPFIVSDCFKPAPGEAMTACRQLVASMSKPLRFESPDVVRPGHRT